MLSDKNQPPEIPTIPQQDQEVEEEELLLLRETATMDSSSFFDDPTTTNTTARFSNLHLTNHPPCSTCGCHGTAPSSSSASLKRSSSESSNLQPNSKRPNINSNSLFGFSKIPLPTTTNSSSLSAPAPNTSPNRPFLRRCISDLCDPLTTNVAAENPQSPPSQNVDVAGPETPLSAARTSKLPPRPPTLRRSVSDPTPSPQTFSSSCDGVGAYNSPNAKWARKMRKCMKDMTRKWDELLGFEEDKGGKESNNQNNSNNVQNKDENSEEECVEAVTVEKSGECLIIHFKCPCGRGYQLLLSGKNCYYKLM